MIIITLSGIPILLANSQPNPIPLLKKEKKISIIQAVVSICQLIPWKI